MTLTGIYEISQAIASIAIIASLLYGALQFRLYVRVVRDERMATYINDIQQFRRQLVESADVARIYRDGMEDFDKLESIDQWRFGALMQQLVHNLDLSRKLGDVFTPNVIDHNIQWMIGRPGAQQWWAKGRHMFNEDTQQYIDRQLVRASHTSLEAQAL
jgi:hypothetical protein